MNIARVLIGTAMILMMPLLAMVLSDEPNWDLFDFVVGGFILFVAGSAFEFVAARTDKRFRLWLAISFIIALFLVFAELSVGIVGSPFAGS